MLLTNVLVDSFKTITTLQEVEIDPRITVLIGANESGKTNLLQAMSRFPLSSDFQPEDISKSRKSKYEKKEWPKVSFTFSINDEERNAVPLLKEVHTIRFDKINNSIDGYSIVILGQSLFKKLIEDKRNIQSTLKACEEDYDRISIEISATKLDLESVEKKEFENRTRIRPANIRNESRELKLSIENFKEKLTKLNEKEKDLEELQANIQMELTQINEKIERAERKDQVLDLKPDLKPDQIQALLQLTPQILYFKDIEFLPESVPITEIIQQKTARSKAFAKLLKIGEIDNLNILNDNARRVKTILIGASGILSKKLSAAWKQEEMQIELTKEGNDIVISFQEQISVSSAPQERSEGFQWFLSFFVNFMLEPNEKQHSKIILLDEPAIQLHPRGQKNFLEIMEKLSESFQIIYTSHSPFLINRNFPSRIRLLEKDSQKGTTINNKAYTDGKCKFWEPLKSAIGICLGDLFSMGETNLIVEGISDQVLLSGISQKLASVNKPFLDLQRIAIVPDEGAITAVYLGEFAHGEKLKTAVLVDNDSEGKKALKNAQEKKLEFNVISVSEFKPEAITIEDLLPVGKYVEAVNSFYEKLLPNSYKAFTCKENQQDKSKGIIGMLREHFERMEISFDKVSVTKELIQKIDIKEEAESYASFVKLFDRVNSIMG